MLNPNFFIGLSLGFLIFLSLSNPNKLKRKVPTIRISRVGLLPEFSIKLIGYKVHIHHWVYLSIIYIFLTIEADNFFTSNNLIKGVFIGGIAQGLTYHDRFKFFHKHNNL